MRLSEVLACRQSGALVRRAKGKCGRLHQFRWCASARGGGAYTSKKETRKLAEGSWEG